MQPVTSSSSAAAAQPAQQFPKNAAPSPSSASPSPPQEQPRSEKEVTLAAKQVEKFVQSISSDLQFTVDDSSGAFVVKVVDRATQEVIRQIPSEEMLAIAKALDRLQGLLVRQQA